MKMIVNAKKTKMSSVTPITRELITNNRYGSDSTYRYFSDGITFGDRYIGIINELVKNYMDSDQKDYLYELCSYNIDYSTMYRRDCDCDRNMEILNAVKKVLGASTFHSIIKDAKSSD